MNEFFPKNELLAGLSELEQNELRTNIGLKTVLDDLSNDTVTTDALTVKESLNVNTSNLILKIGERTSNKFLKSISDDGLATWSALPTYDEMLNATMDVITQDLFDNLDELNNLKIDTSFTLNACNLDKPSVLMNSNEDGLVTWSILRSNFDSNSSSNEVPSMLALEDLYQKSRSNDSNLFSNLYQIATDTSQVLVISNHLSELSNNTDDIMSNLRLSENITTSNLLTSNILTSNVNAQEFQSSNVVAEQMSTSNLIVLKNARVNGGIQAGSLESSNITSTGNFIGNNMATSNLNANEVDSSNVLSSNITTQHFTVRNINFNNASASDHHVLTVINSNLTFQKLNSDYLDDSENTVPSSKALNDALQFMDTRVRTITTDPSFSETYLQINCNLEEIKFFTVENMLAIHSNLRLAKLAREPTWENIENIPADLANLSSFYLTKDLSNIDLGDINVKKLKDSFELQDLAYMTKESVDIRGGDAVLNRVQTDNFVLNSIENNVEEARQNYLDENYLFLRHAGNEGDRVPGTGKWGNLPIKQHYDDIGRNSIPSSFALSNLYTYMITSNRYENKEDESGDIQTTFIKGFLNPYFSNQASESNAATTKALTDLFQYIRNSAGGDVGFLNPEYKNQSSHANAATSKALTDLHDFMRNSAGGDVGFLIPEYKNQSSHANAATSKALTDLHDFMRNSAGGDVGFLIPEYKNQSSHANAATSKALSDLHQFMRNSNDGDVGFLNPEYKNQTSHSNAATAKAVTDLHDFIRNSDGGDLGFLNDNYKDQSSKSNAATTKALSDLYHFLRSSDDGDKGFLNQNYKNQSSHSNAATSKAVSDLHDFVRSSEVNGFLVPHFSNQNSHSNAATAKALTDLYEYLIDGFLVKDYTTGDETTAATSGAVLSLFQHVKSSEFISESVSDSDQDRVVSARTLSNLYFGDLASQDFFKVHNTYIFEEYLKQSMAEKSLTQPFSSAATSNVIHEMITETRKIYNALRDDGILEDKIDTNDFGLLATAQAVYNLSNNTTNQLSLLKDSIYETIQDVTTNLALYDRIKIHDTANNPLDIQESQNSNIDLRLKYSSKYFTLNNLGEFSLDDTAISNIAASSIKIRSTSDDAGFSNLIEVDPVGDGEYEIKFRGTSLLDEISGDVAKSVADALLEYGETDYTFACNLWVKQSVYVDSNIRASNVYFSNMEVDSIIASGMELSNDLLVHGDTDFQSNLNVSSNLTVLGDLELAGGQTISKGLSVFEAVNIEDEMHVFSNVFIGGSLSLRHDLLVDGKIELSDDLAARTIQASNILVTDKVNAVNEISTSNVKASNAESINLEIRSNLTLSSQYHDLKVYAQNLDGSFGNNNVYFEANNVDKMLYSNVRQMILGESDTKVYISGELSVEKNYAKDITVSGTATFHDTIEGTANTTIHVLTDTAVESSPYDQRFYPTTINRSDEEEAFKQLHPFSNMYFDKDLNVNIDTNLSVKSTIIGSNLSVSQLDFDRLGKDVEVQGENIHGTVPSASNIYANRIMSDTDASFYNLSMIKLDLTHGELERKNRVLEFATNMSYQPSENLLSVGKLASDDGYQVGRLNAGALSTTSPVDLNPDINITQQNLQKTDANLSVAFSGESTLTNTISVAEPNNTDGFAQKLVFANVEPESSGSLTVRPDVTYEVDGDDYGLKINTTKVLNNYVSTNELYATNLNIGTSSNDPLHVTKDGTINAREVSSARLIIQESSAFSGAGTSGELKYAGGKFYGHDGTKFMTISSSTANDDETGMFVTEGKNDINFMSASNGTPFDMQIQSNLVKIPDTLSVKNIHVYDETNVRSLILQNSIRLKKYPEIDLIENDNSASSGYVANGSSTLSDQNDFFKCFDGKDTSYDDFGDGTGHYSAWISQTTYDHTTGLPLQDVSPTFPGTDRNGEYCTLKLPTPILLKQIHVFTRGSADFENAAPPKDICLYATNNGVDWTELGVYKDLIFAGREGLRLEAGKIEGTTTITQVGNTLHGDGVIYDQFGWYLVLSSDGTRMAVGARLHDEISSNEGHVRVYDYNSSTSQWVQIGQDINGVSQNERFGSSLAMSADGSRIAVGAPNHDSSRGTVRVYDYNTSTSQWVQVGGDIDGHNVGDQSGYSLEMSSDGTRVAIGSPAHDTGRGEVRVFDYNATTSQWNQVGGDINGEALEDQWRDGLFLSEQSLAISSDGSRVAVGAIYNDGNGSNSGHVRVFDYSGSQWVQVGSDIDGEAYGDSSGWSVSMSADGARIAVGAVYNDGNGGQISDSGHIRVYDYSGSQWIQVGSDIDGKVSNESAGWSMRMSSDGTRLAFGTRKDKVRVYDYSGSEWVQVHDDITGTSGELFGWCVSLSSDGNVIAVGAPYAEDVQIFDGEVRVYHINQEKYKKFNQFAVQVECITVQGNKPAYCAIGRIDFYTEDETATYTDLDGRLEGVPGQLIYSDGKILVHDGDSFKSITGSTANLDRTGMFLIEGEPHIKFRANSDSNATEFFDVKIDEQKTEFNSNVRVRADLSVGGATTFSGHLIPSVAESFDIGSTESAVRDLFLSENSIWVGDSAKISFTNGKMKFRRRKLHVVPAAILDAGSDAGHDDHEQTKNAALAHAGVGSIADMKLRHWVRYMRTLRPNSTVGDIFRRDHKEDYEATVSSEAWYETDGSDSKVYTEMLVGIKTDDPQDALHVNGKMRVENGFVLVKKGSVDDPSNPAVSIDTNHFGTDTEVVDRTTTGGVTSFTKLYRVFGRTSDGSNRSWHWGIPNDDHNKFGLGWDGAGDPDPDVGFVFTTDAALYCATVHAANFMGNASTATKLATAVNINGVSFDGSQSVLIHEVSSDDPTTTPLKKVSANGLTDSYNFILHGPLPAETEGGAIHFINGVGRTEDGGQSTYTIRNDNGDLRLGRTGSKTKIEGTVEFENPPSAPKLTTAVNINGVPFDGSQDISITAPRLTTAVHINGIPFDGSQDINFNLSGNANTATKLETARSINGVSFDGSQDINVNGLNYNVNNGWLRENGDNAHVKLYGNSRQMVFRTDGTSQYASHIGGYPFAWMYGGDESGDRIMLLNTSGQLWTSNYGWLHDKFQPKGNYQPAGSYQTAGDYASRHGNSGYNFYARYFEAQHGTRIYGQERSYDYPDHDHDYWKNGGQIQGDTGKQTFGLYVGNWIRAPGYVAFSDKRIKKDFLELDDNLALEKLRRLKPLTYGYKDKARPNERVIGFIAQEVAEVLPHAVSRQPEFIPNIQTDATVTKLEEGETFQLTLSEPHPPSVGSVLKLSTPDMAHMRCKVETVSNDTTFTVSMLDDTNLDEVGRVWVYGEEVNDFHHLDKNAVFTVATAALQEVDRRQQADQLKIASLESKVAELERLVASLVN